MSSKKPTEIQNPLFIGRFVELLGDKPAEIGRKLNVDYQSAKNYLNGRKPNAEVLERIVEVTGVSLNWLLMGQGTKFLQEEFDLERSVERNGTWHDVINEWYVYEGRRPPEEIGASFMGGWDRFTKDEKLAAIRDYKLVLDRLMKQEN